jgi:hypothetical protein
MQLLNSTQNSARRRHNPTAPKWDLGLAVLESHASYGVTFNNSQIASACGVSPRAVGLLVEKCLRRLKPRLAAEKRLLAK